MATSFSIVMVMREMIAICRPSRRCLWLQSIRRQLVRRMLILGCGAATLAGCAPSHPPADRLYPPRELSDLVTGHTMRIGAVIGTHPHTLIYLAPDGTGWLDAQVGQTALPSTGSMSMLTNWYLATGSQVCATATPLIGLMPSFASAKLVCVQLLRPAPCDDAPTAVVMSDRRYQALLLALYPFNAFPNATIEQYRLQVSVLFGGQIPTWSLP
jgi:hypothetical protein